MNWQERIDNYVKVTGYPRSLFVADDGRVVGTWIMGNNYKVKSGLYGGYPAGYLRRISALFPERSRVLHVFSGSVDLKAMPGHTVDIRGECNPTYPCDAHLLSKIVPVGFYDLYMADPPYSVEDADHYKTTMVQRNIVVAQLAKVAPVGSFLVWLDQTLPMYRKDEWSVEAAIGMMKSTNHRFRVVTIFKRL